MLVCCCFPSVCSRLLQKLLTDAPLGVWSAFQCAQQKHRLPTQWALTRTGGGAPRRSLNTRLQSSGFINAEQRDQEHLYLKARPPIYAQVQRISREKQATHHGLKMIKKMSPSESDFDIPAKNCYRMVILGSTKVGKTAIVSRFLNGRFDEQYTPTIEDFHRKLYSIKGDVYQLDILDTSGNHPFPAMRRLSILTGTYPQLCFNEVEWLCRNQKSRFLNVAVRTVRLNAWLRGAPVHVMQFCYRAYAYCVII